jgi:hypothetical protein
MNRAQRRAARKKGRFVKAGGVGLARPGETGMRVLTREEVAGIDATTLFVPVPEEVAFYADPSPVVGPAIPGAEEVSVILCLPQWAWDKVGTGWIASPDQAHGFVVLWKEGQPLEEDVFAPLHPAQAAEGADPYADAPTAEEIREMLAADGYEYLGHAQDPDEPGYTPPPEDCSLLVARVRTKYGFAMVGMFRLRTQTSGALTARSSD